MLRRMALVRTDVSEELSASFIRVTRFGELRRTLTVTSNRRTLRRNTKHAPRPPDTSVLTRATRGNIPEDGILHSHLHGNLKSYVFYTIYKWNVPSIQRKVRFKRSNWMRELGRPGHVFIDFCVPVLTPGRN
jgi:hypothetical protein